MAQLLHIDSSSRGEHSHSRRITKEFVETWQQSHPQITVTYRDVGRNPVPHVDEAWTVSAFTSPEKRTPQMWEAIGVSDQLIDEFLAADVYVIGVPMYNFSIPSTFKAYIDQIVRIGRTWVYEPQDSQTPQKPLVHGKKMFVITTRGDMRYGDSGSNERLNYLEPYLKSVFGFIGITDITFIMVEDDKFGGQKLANSIDIIEKYLNGDLKGNVTSGEMISYTA